MNWLGFELVNEKDEVIERYCTYKALSEFRGDLAGFHWSAIVFIKDLPDFLQSAFFKYETLLESCDIYALINLFTDARGQNTYYEVTAFQYVSCMEIATKAYLNKQEGADFIIPRRAFEKVKDALTEAIDDVWPTIIELPSLKKKSLSQDKIEEKRELLIKGILGMNRYPFIETLRGVCSNVGFEVDENSLNRFKNNRNDLVHKGIFHLENGEGPKPETLSVTERWNWYGGKDEERYQELRFIEDFVGKFILCALGHSTRLSGW